MSDETFIPNCQYSKYLQNKSEYLEIFECFLCGEVIDEGAEEWLPVGPNKEKEPCCQTCKEQSEMRCICCGADLGGYSIKCRVHPHQTDLFDCCRSCADKSVAKYGERMLSVGIPDLQNPVNLNNF